MTDGILPMPNKPYVGAPFKNTVPGFSGDSNLLEKVSVVSLAFLASSLEPPVSSWLASAEFPAPSVLLASAKISWD